MPITNSSLFTLEETIMRNQLGLFIALAFTGGLLAVSCVQKDKNQSAPETKEISRQESAPDTSAVAALRPAKGSKVNGSVQFIPKDNGVQVIADVKGLKKNAKHGFHVHEFGDCTDPKFQSAGGHFNPTNAPHAGPETEQRHWGDLGNIISDGNGHARYDQLITHLPRSTASILGRAVIIHQNADDLTTQPSGDSGGRIACGVIGIDQAPSVPDGF